MANFAKAAEAVLGHEGGYVNHPDDKGGPTNFGVTAATLGEHRKLGREATADEVKALTRDEALDIYRARYWDAPGIEHIRDDRIACKVFDLAINAGPVQAIKILQRAIDHAAPPGVERVRDDGQLGPRTLASLAACDPDVVLGAYCSEQASFYLTLIERNPSQVAFKKGWLARAAWKPDEEVA